MSTNSAIVMSGGIATSLTQQAQRDFSGDAETSFLPDIGSLPALPIKILVVDGHELVREGLVSLIGQAPDLQVVGQAGLMREAITLTRRLRPDVVLMDFTLLDGTGEEAARAILSALPTTKIVFLTAHDDDARLFAAISAGAMGYLLKSIRAAELLSQLRHVVRDEVALSPSIGRRLLEAVGRRLPLRPAEPAALEALSAREGQILRLIAQGHTNREIAAALYLSVRTVEYHRANVMGKLGLRSRADLVRYAAEHDLSLVDSVLTPQQKAANQALARRRVRIER